VASSAHNLGNYEVIWVTVSCTQISPIYSQSGETHYKTVIHYCDSGIKNKKEMPNEVTITENNS